MVRLANYFLIASFVLSLSGCANDHRLPFSGNNLNGYLFKERKCSIKPCGLEHIGEFIFYVNEQSQKVIYKLSVDFESKNNNIRRVYLGELENCRVFSVTEFFCSGLSNNKGNLKFSYKWETSSLSPSRPDNFEAIDSISDSFSVYLLSFTGILSAKSKDTIENYDELAFFFILLLLFSSLPAFRKND